jgi:hypothetical protein
MLTLAIVVLALAVGFVVAVPLAIAGLVIGGVVFLVGSLIVLPLRLIGWSVSLGAGVILLFVKIFLALLLAVIGVALLLAFSLPLLPLVLIALGFWLSYRALSRPRRATV